MAFLLLSGLVYVQSQVTVSNDFINTFALPSQVWHLERNVFQFRSKMDFDYSKFIQNLSVKINILVRLDID